MPRDHLRLAVDALIDVWKELGPLVGISLFPGAALIPHALGALEILRNPPPARRLESLLEQAERDFLQQAPAQGLGHVAQWVASLPLHNLQTFRQALQALRDHWDEQALRDRLAQEPAHIPGLHEGERARALALYLDCLRARLLADPEFREAVLALNALRTEREMRRL
jgi:hypothetical protein